MPNAMERPLLLFQFPWCACVGLHVHVSTVKPDHTGLVMSVCPYNNMMWTQYKQMHGRMHRWDLGAGQNKCAHKQTHTHTHVCKSKHKHISSLTHTHRLFHTVSALYKSWYHNTTTPLLCWWISVIGTLISLKTINALRVTFKVRFKFRVRVRLQWGTMCICIAIFRYLHTYSESDPPQVSEHPGGSSHACRCRHI